MKFKRLKILEHKNLKMSRRKLAAQCVHAAIDLKEKFPDIRHWSCVVLEASTKKFQEAKIAHPEASVVTDAGYTEVAPGSETVMAWYEEEPHEIIDDISKLILERKYANI